MIGLPLAFTEVATEKIPVDEHLGIAVAAGDIFK